MLEREIYSALDELSSDENPASVAASLEEELLGSSGERGNVPPTSAAHIMATSGGTPSNYEIKPRSSRRSSTKSGAVFTIHSTVSR